MSQIVKNVAIMALINNVSAHKIVQREHEGVRFFDKDSEAESKKAFDAAYITDSPEFLQTSLVKDVVERIVEKKIAPAKPEVKISPEQ